MARERWPKARRSSGANQRALRSSAGAFFFVILVSPSCRSADLQVRIMIFAGSAPLQWRAPSNELLPERILAADPHQIIGRIAEQNPGRLARAFGVAGFDGFHDRAVLLEGARAVVAQGGQAKALAQSDLEHLGDRPEEL